MRLFEEVMTKMENKVWELQDEMHSHERSAPEGEDHELPFKLEDQQCGVCQQRRKSRRNYIVQCDICRNWAHNGCAVMYTVEKKSKSRYRHISPRSRGDHPFSGRIKATDLSISGFIFLTPSLHSYCDNQPYDCSRTHSVPANYAAMSCSASIINKLFDEPR